MRDLKQPLDPSFWNRHSVGWKNGGSPKGPMDWSKASKAHDASWEAKGARQHAFAGELHLGEVDPGCPVLPKHLKNGM